MENMIEERARKYQKEKNITYQNAIREVVQEVTLYALSTTDFFSLISFCGGTSLRIAYDLRRSSEDLDFSSINKLDDFSFEKYFPKISKTFEQLGMNVTLSEKKSLGTVKSAFLKSDTFVKEIYLESSTKDGHVPLLKIKMEVDTNPPLGAEYEYKRSLFPYPHKYLIQNRPSLFAGKIHALLCRNWIKGRDYYDYLFYINKETDINMTLLEQAMRQTGHYLDEEKLSKDKLEKMLLERFMDTNIDEVKADCLRFVDNPEELSQWDNELFIEVTKEYFKKK